MKVLFVITAMMLSLNAQAFESIQATQTPSIICHDGADTIVRAYNAGRDLPQAVLVVEKQGRNQNEVLFNAPVKSSYENYTVNYVGQGYGLKAVEMQNGEVRGFLSVWQNNVSTTHAMKCQVVFQIMEDNNSRYNPDI